MSDKFRANLWIVLPAAIATMIIYTILGSEAAPVSVDSSCGFWPVLPYIVIIATALMGINVTIVLSLGIVSSLILALIQGTDIMTLCGYMGTGIASMGDLIVITLLAAGMLGIIKAAGGISFILQCLTNRISSVAGARRASWAGGAREPVHGQQHRGHNHGGIARPLDSLEVRDSRTPHSQSSRHGIVHRTVYHTLRCADSAGHIAGRHIAGGSVPVSLLPLGSRAVGSRSALYPLEARR